MHRTADTGMWTAQTAGRLIRLMMDRFLYWILLLFLLGNTFSCFLDLCSNMETLVYITADSSIVGKLPNRLFGLLTYRVCSVDFVFFLMKALYFAAMSALAFAVYLFLKRIKNLYYQLIAVPSAIYFTSFLLNIWGVKPYFLCFMIALTLALFAWYLLFFYHEYWWVSVLLMFAAELIDCRLVLLILPFALILCLVTGNKRKKVIKVCVLGLIGACIGFVLVLSLPLLQSYYSGESLSDDSVVLSEFQAYGDVLSEEYPQYIKGEALQSKMSEYLNTPHTLAYFYSDSYELLVNSPGLLFLLKYILFDDGFQMMLLLSFVLMLIAQHIERAGCLEAQKTQQ